MVSLLVLNVFVFYVNLSAVVLTANGTTNVYSRCPYEKVCLTTPPATRFGSRASMLMTITVIVVHRYIVTMFFVRLSNFVILYVGLGNRPTSELLVNITLDTIVLSTISSYGLIIWVCVLIMCWYGLWLTMGWKRKERFYVWGGGTGLRRKVVCWCMGTRRRKTTCWLVWECYEMIVFGKIIRMDVDNSSISFRFGALCMWCMVLCIRYGRTLGFS